MTNIKQQIKQLEEYAQTKSDIVHGENSAFSQGFVAGQRDAAELALAIIKKLQQELWVVKANSDDCDNWNQQLREENEKLKAKDKTCSNCELCVCQIAHG